MLFLQSVRTTLNFRLRVATALSAHCPLVAESGITTLGASVAPYQRLVFNFLGVMENPDSFLGVIPKLSFTLLQRKQKRVKEPRCCTWLVALPRQHSSRALNCPVV